MVEHKRELKEIELNKVVISEANVRKSDIETDIDSLAGSIRDFGLLHPIEVRKNGEFYEVIQGQRRTLASKKLGLSTILAFVLQEDIPEREDYIRSLIEGIERVDLPDQDKANAVKKLINETGSIGAAAKILNRNIQTLHKWLEYDKIPEKVKSKIVKGANPGNGLSKNDAIRLSKSVMNIREMEKIAEKISKIDNLDQKRDVLNYIERNPSATAEDIERKFVVETNEPVVGMTLMFNPRISKAIMIESDKRNEEPPTFVTSIVREYLENKGLLKD